MFGIGFGELLVIALILIIVVGPSRLPSLMRTLGKTVRAARQASDELKASVGFDELTGQRPWDRYRPPKTPGAPGAPGAAEGRKTAPVAGSGNEKAASERPQTGADTSAGEGTAGLAGEAKREAAKPGAESGSGPGAESGQGANASDGDSDSDSDSDSGAGASAARDGKAPESGSRGEAG